MNAHLSGHVMDFAAHSGAVKSRLNEKAEKIVKSVVS